MSSAELLTCPSCGSSEPRGSAFCGACGAPLAAAPEPLEGSTTTDVEPAGVLTCPSCGNEEPEGAEFCGNCGASFEPAPAPEPEPAEAAAPSPRRSRRPFVLAAALVVAGGAAVAILFGTGVVGGGGGKGLLESTLVGQVNARVLGPLGLAVDGAAGHAGSGDDAFTSSDGERIVQVAGEGSRYLRGLHDLSDTQKAEVGLLLGFVSASRHYGEALSAFEPADGDSRVSLDDAVDAVRSARAEAEGTLPSDLRVPPEEAYVTSQQLPAPAPPPPPVAEPSASSYVQQVDALLNRSRPVVLALRSFIPRASSGSINRAEAVSMARSYVAQRQLELNRARALRVPSAFAPSQSLLLRSLESSVADDEALVAWAVARRDGGGNAQAAFEQANRLGAHATALKKTFLRVYGQERQQTTGRSPETLPDIF
ncbi:MAG TPA: zinc ribbon domain-containing protein [Gaiellaceae bacterium]